MKTTKKPLSPPQLRTERPKRQIHYSQGLVIGKFCPPHKGHHYLIDFALSRVDELDVLVCDHPKYTINAKTRADWLRQRHPKASVYTIKDIELDDDSAAWAEHTTRFLGYAPDIVFSSEDYGDEYARLMGAVHYKLDRARKTVPIAATMIRGDVLKHWDFLEPNVRAPFALRVCVLGAESTGTTTLSQALAAHYEAPWVPEYGRLYSEALISTKHKWQSSEFTFIAHQQQLMESQMAGQSNGLVICDTNAFATRLWHERYMGDMEPAVDAIAAEDKVDLYIITGDEIPFVQDGVRDGEYIRHAMHQRFVQEVRASGIPYLIVKGSVQQRFNAVYKQVNQLLERKITI